MGVEIKLTIESVGHEENKQRKEFILEEDFPEIILKS